MLNECANTDASSAASIPPSPTAASPSSAAAASGLFCCCASASQSLNMVMIMAAFAANLASSLPYESGLTMAASYSLDFSPHIFLARSSMMVGTKVPTDMTAMPV